MEDYRIEQLNLELEVVKQNCDEDDTSTEFMLAMLEDTVTMFEADYKQGLDSNEYVMEWLYESRDRTQDT